MWIVDKLDKLVYIIDTIAGNVLNTKRKRHIVSGFLTSMSLFFGVLAFTVITMK